MAGYFITPYIQAYVDVNMDTFNISRHFVVFVEQI